MIDNGSCAFGGYLLDSGNCEGCGGCCWEGCFVGLFRPPELLDALDDGGRGEASWLLFEEVSI